ncbi:general secretion pathway protein GspG [Desulfobacter hydrogenophilus]|uniref:General secretion pathway protein GspG n=1 Tax=Desulfobacter hydrogenophilus TaxID=2291 RepID=A0A328F7P0_9BACT|nr:general secretion pathway protein GspG [Desulfobacter hydrogenophilus]NDY73620.1 general secretion pathway protein GspG [Desulfobacter hydrogenophilus]QBH12113.1 general secretion pathway protein GspG [Desulfobacter hydrogenophilus]RAM00664.1 general secretion pathway protein GspG [Desulfobacter hydrogenophilus]
MVEIIRQLIMGGVALGIIVGNSESILQYYDDTVAMARQVATAGDLRSISLMLDYEFMKRGRLPKKERFGRWLGKNFKENELKAVMVDHWGNDMVYLLSRDGKTYTLQSPGPDGLMDTEDDMTRTGP